MIFIKQKSDILGAAASTLCLIHCVATPFIFIAQTCAVTCCNDTPVWWKFIDYFFLIISFFAIYRSTQTTASNWIKPLLWSSWFLLLIVIVNEKLAWFTLHDTFIYVPAVLLITLHLYNRKYCQCNTNKCCAHEG